MYLFSCWRKKKKNRLKEDQNVDSDKKIIKEKALSKSIRSSDSRSSTNTGGLTMRSKLQLSKPPAVQLVAIRNLERARLEHILSRSRDSVENKHHRRRRSEDSSTGVY